MWTSYNTRDLNERYLFKFLPGKRLFEFLETGNIWFSRADKFGDKMECVTIRDIEVGRPNYKDIEKRKKRFLISCWHLADKESLAFWDTYAEKSEDRKNFALRFKRKNLTNLFYGIFNANDAFYYQTKWLHGKVVYKNLINSNTDRLNKSKIRYPAFRKEAAFKYENEYRFVIELNQPYNEEGYNYNIGEPQQIPFDILINPVLKSTESNPLAEKIRALGFGEKLRPSVLTKWLQPDKW